VQELEPGDLVRWIIDYRVVVVMRIDTGTHKLMHMIHDGFIVISKANGG
jgi:hypothetical protein